MILNEFKTADAKNFVANSFSDSEHPWWLGWKRKNLLWRKIARQQRHCRCCCTNHYLRTLFFWKSPIEARDVEWWRTRVWVMTICRQHIWQVDNYAQWTSEWVQNKKRVLDNLPEASVTKLGNFWKFPWTNFPTKVAQTFDDIWATLISKFLM